MRGSEELRYWELADRKKAESYRLAVRGRQSEVDTAKRR